ncbi:hypothetical protein [Scytonema sp. NUACC26]|uniref:hypothetical protein n=1 Tax=Scytonema sp. NUACC26 TaxID=3140176 RepID=UPI0034DCAD4D
MIFIYFLLAGSACSFCWAVFDIYRVLKHHRATQNGFDWPPTASAGVRLPSRPPSGTGTAFALPEIEGNSCSRVP